MLVVSILSIVLLGQSELPGSQLSIEEAIAKSRIIVVAELETYHFSQLLGGADIMAGGRFKITGSIKGAAKNEDMKDLSVCSYLKWNEKLPKPKEEGIYFLDDFAKHLNAVKVLPKTEKNLEAVRRAIQAK
jgi:hypothetical protein